MDLPVIAENQAVARLFQKGDNVMAAMNGVSNYSYNYFDYNSWEKKATDQANQIKEIGRAHV